MNPKAKKPTPLKKARSLTQPGIKMMHTGYSFLKFIIFILLDLQVILKEREERKQKRLLEERGVLPENESKLADVAEEEQNDAELSAAAGQSRLAAVEAPQI